MRELGIEGCRRRRKVFTTRPDPDALRAPDLVNRNFTAERPERVVGHRPDLRADAVGDGLRVLHRRRVLPADRRLAGRVEHAHRDGPRRARDGPLVTRRPRLVGLVAHSDAGSQFTSVRFTERLDEIGARPSIGTVADCYDNALAETTNGLYKTECVYGPDTRPLGRRRRARARDLVVGALVQRAPPPRPLRRRAARRVRSSVLRCPTGRPRRGWKPITRASIKPRAVHR